MTVLEQYQKDLATFEASQLTTLRDYLREMLEMLPNPDMEINLNSDKVDGNAIHIGNYTDHISTVNGRGETTVYNNVDCDNAFSTKVYDDKVTIFGFNLATTAEIVKCVEKHFKKINNKYVTFNDTIYQIGEHTEVSEGNVETTIVELFDVQSEIDSDGTHVESVFMCKYSVMKLPRASQDSIAIAEAFYATK